MPHAAPQASLAETSSAAAFLTRDETDLKPAVPYSVHVEHPLDRRAVFLSALTAHETRMRACLVSLVVGTVLVAINQGDTMLTGAWPTLWKIPLTYAVPYCVSSYSSAAARVASLAAGRRAG